ncbi:LytR/AlgR family response regulator transcription factor [Thermophagus xiamenensis]|uniref:Two component transcriptional regulator, LytTR family n=1 Tax=Thermophagus xiamenensis TaxID=385682 RepID=A0A1I1UGL2_9BACT|nr:LytTR family transcriptional regulator DNA-binding domain-containing protein [Thermophagus xiamenensis]SFD70002.1 two component transcriptional regulator, LytTR family [Thermophagus xiamenensis]
MPKSNFTALIIDDEPPARTVIRSYLNDHPNISVIGECSNGFEALKAIQELKPDIIFLDVQMPKVSGLELLEVLDEIPVVVFSTAYDRYALKAFEMSAVDYLLKPYSQDRFNKAMGKVLEQLNKGEKTDATNLLIKHSENSNTPLKRIVVKTGNKMHVIPVNKISYIEANEDYVMIYSEKSRHLKAQTMRYYEENLDSTQFVRIHRSFIVNVNFVERLEPYDKDTYVAVMTQGQRLKISRNGYRKLKETLNF